MDQHRLQSKGSDSLPHLQLGLRLLTPISHSRLHPHRILTSPHQTQSGNCPRSRVRGVPGTGVGPGCGQGPRAPSGSLPTGSWLTPAGPEQTSQGAVMCLAPRGPSDPASGSTICPGGPPPTPRQPQCHFRPFPVPGIHAPLLADGRPQPNLSGFPVWPPRPRSADALCARQTAFPWPEGTSHPQLALGLHPPLGVPP